MSSEIEGPEVELRFQVLVDAEEDDHNQCKENDKRDTHADGVAAGIHLRSLRQSVVICQSVTFLMSLMPERRIRAR
jgi:hypothetical protein